MKDCLLILECLLILKKYVKILCENQVKTKWYYNKRIKKNVIILCENQVKTK